MSLAPEAERVALLVRKYQGTSTAREDARIDVLTQCLRRLSPRVTPEDLNSLSAMVRKLEEMGLEG